MLHIRTLAFAAISALSLCGSTWAAECTVERDALDEALGRAPSCAAAYKMFQDCAFGSSADVPLGDTVRQRCEKDFLSKIDAARKRAYDRRIAACERKYANKQGTIYLSFAAFCRAGAARDLAKRYAK